MKLIGCLMVIAGCGGIGFLQGREYRGRLLEWKEMKRLCLLLHSEIGYRKLPLPEAFRAVAGQVKDPCKSLLLEASGRLDEKGGESISQIWRQAVLKHLKGTFLKPADIERFALLGEQMGFLDREIQLSAIDWFEQELQRDIGLNEKKVEHKVHICNCLGILGGLFLAVLFL